MEFEVTVDGILGIENKIAGIRDKLTARDNALYQDLSILMLDSIQQNFASEGRPRWESRKYDYPHPILDKTGTMRDIAEMSTNPSNWQHSSAEHHLDINSTDYANYHQHGTSRLPVRKFVQLTAGEEDAAAQLLTHVFEG